MIFKDNFYNRLSTVSIILAGCLLLYVLMPVLVPFIVAFILAYLLNPVVEWVTKFNISRGFAIVLVLLLISIVLITAISYIIPLLWEQFETAKSNMPIFLDWLNNNARPWISEKLKYDIKPFNSNEISDEILSYLQTNYNLQDARSIVSKIASSGISAISSVGLFVLVPVLMFFFLMSWHKNMKSLINVCPPRFQSQTLSVAKDCHEVMMAFVKGQMLVMFILGLIYGIGLQILGIETGIIIGFVAGLASIIPYFGLVVGVIAAVIAVIVQFGFDWHLLALVGVFGFGQFIEGMVLQPILLGDRIGLSPIMVIFVVLVGGSLMGVVGMIIALPFAAVLMVLMRHVFASYQDSEFYKRKAEPALAGECQTADFGFQADTVLNTSHSSEATVNQTTVNPKTVNQKTKQVEIQKDELVIISADNKPEHTKKTLDSKKNLDTDTKENQNHEQP